MGRVAGNGGRGLFPGGGESVSSRDGSKVNASAGTRRWSLGFRGTPDAALPTPYPAALPGQARRAVLMVRARNRRKRLI